MNGIPVILPIKIQRFFKKIENDLDTNLFFYGSVTRSDYIPNKSDIDVALFTDNEYSDMHKLQHILHLRKNEIDKIVWRLNGNMIYGYKIKIKDINCELTIFNNDFKDILLDEFTKPNKNNSIIIYGLLFILKVLYYQIPLLNKKTYSELKRYIMNDLMVKKDSIYHVLHQ
jgi:hypothetical protein